MSEFKAIETQEQFDAAISELLKRERETVRKEFEGYLSPEEEGEKYAGYLSPDDEKKKYKDYLSPEEVAKKDAKIKGYETDSVKMRIAHEAGLSYDAVAFLKGEDEDSIRKSAETLKSIIGTNNLAPLASTESRVDGTQETALKNTLKGLKGD